MNLTLSNLRQLQLLIFTGFGIICGLVVIFVADLPDTYIMVILFGLAFPFIAMMAGNLRRFLLAGLVLSIPLTIDVNFMHVFENQAGSATMGISLRDIIVCLLLIYWIIELAVNEKKPFKMHLRLFLPALLYLELCAFSIIWAPRGDLAVLEIVQMAKVFLMFCIVANQLRTREDIELIVWVLTFTILLEGSIALLQFFTGKSLSLGFIGEMQVATEGGGRLERAGGTLGHPNRLALYLELLLPVCLSAYLIAQRKAFRFFAGAAFAIGFASMIMTGSRGGWMGTLLAFMFYIFFLIRNKQISAKVVIRTIIMTVLVLAVFLLVLWDNIEKRLFGEDNGSAISRIPMFQIAWSMIQVRPLLGTGINNYAVLMRNYNDTLIGRRFRTIPRPVHNMYLLIAGETGIIGLALFLTLLSSMIRTALHTIRSDVPFISITGTGLLCGYAAFMIHGLVDKHPPGGYALFYLMLAMLAGLYTLSHAAPEGEGEADAS